jgi:NitT/TauT family transport system ATP-binding protein
VVESTQTPLGIRISGVTKRFDAETILDGLELGIDPGSFTVLVGPSGCGKTTLLRTIGQMEAVTSGQVDVLAGDTVLKDVEADRIGYCFQESRLLPWRTVLANVTLPLEIRGFSLAERNERGLETLRMAGLTGHDNKLPHQLSGGMQMRVSIARALITKPGLLLLDEPFSALDEISRARMDDELLRVWREFGLTVVLVTHSLTEAVYLGQTVHFMSETSGKIVDSLDIDLPERTPEIRSSSDFAQWVALAHGILATSDPVQPS